MFQPLFSLSPLILEASHENDSRLSAPLSTCIAPLTNLIEVEC